MAVSFAQLFRQWSNDRRITAPAVDLVVATLSDTVDDPAGVSRGFYLDTAGTVKFTTVNGTHVTLAGLSAGVVYPVGVRKFFSTGTTATATDIYMVY